MASRSGKTARQPVGGPLGSAMHRGTHRDKLGGGRWGVAIVVCCETSLRRDESAVGGCGFA